MTLKVAQYMLPKHLSAIIWPMGMADVAAGDGALHTWSILSV
jgi:hypothetical protein